MMTFSLSRPHPQRFQKIREYLSQASHYAKANHHEPQSHTRKYCPKYHYAKPRDQNKINRDLLHEITRSKLDQHVIYCYGIEAPCLSAANWSTWSLRVIWWYGYVVAYGVALTTWRRWMKMIFINSYRFYKLCENLRVVNPETIWSDLKTSGL